MAWGLVCFVDRRLTRGIYLKFASPTLASQHARATLAL